jgi:hypothetical protein
VTWVKLRRGVAPPRRGQGRAVKRVPPAFAARDYACGTQVVSNAMFAKRGKQSSQRRPPSDDASRTERSGTHSRGAATEQDLEEQRSTTQSLQQELDAARFKIEMLEKSYAKQLAELRDKRAALEAELKEKDEILAGLGGPHEHTLRELSDAIAVIKVLKKERDQLRKQIAQGAFRQPSDRPSERPTIAARLLGDSVAPRAIEDTSDGTINSLIANESWAEKKPHVGTGQASAKVESPDPPLSKEEMLSPDLVFTDRDKEPDDER